MFSSGNLFTVLKLLLILIFAVWVSLWLLKPTEFWTKSWHKAEDAARETVFGYYGLNFVVYSVPIMAIAAIGFIYLHLYSKIQRNRQVRMSITNLSNPLIVSRTLGVVSGAELIAVTIFIVFLAWTMYAHLSKDFKKMVPSKSLKLNMWQFKFMKVGTRLGLLAEACLALLLLPVLRGMSLFRLIGFQFEASIRYHIFLGTAMIFFATLHGASTFLIWGVKHRILDEMWLWQNTGRVYLAGELALVTGLVIWITSLPQIRRKWFEIFYYTHHLYAVFLVLFLIHAGDRHFYMVFSGVLLFGLDKLLRIIQSRAETCVLSARIFPCKAVELNLTKNPSLSYTPTSLIFLKVPSISKLQWHPFSIISSSSVSDDRISVIVKGDGWWTKSLYNTIVAAHDSDPYQDKCLPIHVEGPYGPPSTDFLRYESVILVAGGIGVTPLLSILQEITSTQNRQKTLTRIRLVYAVKKSVDISLLNPISHLLLNQSLSQPSLAVNVFVTQEEKSSTTLRELLNEQIPQVQTVNFDSKSTAISGMGSLPWLAGVVGISSVVFFLALVLLNHAFVHSEKKDSEKKNPSWITNLLLICSFIIALLFGGLATMAMKLRKSKKDIPSSLAVKQTRETEFGYLDSKASLEDHEIHYGRRPNFEDIFSKFPNQNGDSNIGVLVCGPESMIESVAILCRQHSHGFTNGGKGRKPHFNFHSLNFAL